jgi:hypothetical protein
MKPARHAARERMPWPPRIALPTPAAAVLCVVLAGLAAGASAMSDSRAAPVPLRCVSTVAIAPDMLERLCAAVRAALADRAAQAADGAPPGLSVTLTVTSARATSLQAHLSWQVAGGPQETGPTGTFGSTDAPLPAARIGKFARGLVYATELPLGDGPEIP